MALSIRSGTTDDLSLLAQMNKRLIEDEGSRKPMSVAELERRMRGWLESGWLIDIFLEDGSVIGYAVYRRCTDDYHPDQTVIHLRQLFIERGHRNRGLGTLAFRDLVRTKFPRRSTVVIDVLASNPKGLTFWERLGFRAYSTKMRLD